MGKKIWVPYAAGGARGVGPVLNVEITSANGTRFPTRAILDSGATQTVFPASLAETLGIDVSGCKVDEASTPSGIKDVLHPKDQSVEVYIEEVNLSYETHPLFFPDGKSVLLGRDDAFELLRITFDHRRGGMYLEPYGNEYT